MSILWRAVKGLAIVVGLTIALLLAPVAWTEIACRPTGSAAPYAAILPPAHHRPESRTLMTYPEWDIVHAYEDYAQVLATGDPHDYRFLAGITGYWGSLCAVSKAAGAHGGIDGGTKQMVYVIGASFTAEWLLKAAYEETVGQLFTLLRGPAPAPLDRLSAAQAQAYATFLQQTPWYRWDFSADARALSQAATPVLRDRERANALGIEYRAKAAYARVIAAAVSEVGNDALTLRMIVTGIAPDRLAAFDGLTVIGLRDQGIEIETVRYRALTALLHDLARAGADFVEIAGNDEIMFTVLSESPTLPGAFASRQRQGAGDYRHLRLTRVTALAQDLRALDTSAARLEHVHDY